MFVCGKAPGVPMAFPSDRYVMCKYKCRVSCVCCGKNLQCIRPGAALIIHERSASSAQSALEGLRADTTSRLTYFAVLVLFGAPAVQNSDDI